MDQRRRTARPPVVAPLAALAASASRRRRPTGGARDGRFLPSQGGRSLSHRAYLADSDNGATVRRTTRVRHGLARVRRGGGGSVSCWTYLGD